MARINRRWGPRYRWVGAALAAVALLTACSGSKSTSASSTSGSGSTTPQSGGQITIGLNSPITCVDPLLYQSNATQYINRNVVDSLVAQEPKTGKIVPWLATSWDVSPNGLTYTFHLRHNVTFSDGSPFTAQVVKDNFDKIEQLGAAWNTYGVSDLDGYVRSVVVNTYTVQVVFSKVNVPFLQGASTTSLAIESEGTLKESTAQRCTGAVVGTGPFTIKSHDPAGMDTVLVKRKGYDWAPSTEAHQGEAYLDSINFETIVDAGVRAGDLQTGTIDMDTAPLTISSYLNNPAYGIVGRIYPGMNQSFLPNLSHPITAELAVRQAISLAIDRNAIVSGLLTKYDKVATSVIASNTPYYQPLTGIQYDPAKAKALLQNAGWVPGPGGIRVKNGSNLTLVLAYTGNGRQSGPIVQLVQEELRTVGINLQIKLMTPAQSAETQASGDFDIWFTPSFRAEPDIVRERIAFSGDNLGKAPAPRPVDSLLVQQESEENTQQRQQTITEALQELVDQADVIPLYESAGLYVYNSRLHGVDTDANSLLTLYDTWVSRS